jgi:S-adenosylmethionine:tRNA-ribosyltransferase-isomerase (queuine synthetase)
MKTSELEFRLPERLIAMEPVPGRTGSSLISPGPSGMETCYS